MKGLIKAGDNVFIQGGQMTPKALVQQLWATGIGVTVLHRNIDSPIEYPDNVKVRNLFVGKTARHTLVSDQGDYMPMSLSLIPKSIREGVIPVNVAMVSVSTPDEAGMVSIGSSVDITPAALEAASVRIAQVNSNVPRVCGHKYSLSYFTKLIVADDPIPEPPQVEADAEQKQIAKNVAGLIEDGSTVQMGIGAISSYVGKELCGHRGLSVLTEMITDSVIDMVETGAVTSPVVTAFAVCSSAGLQKIVDNPMFEFKSIDYTNSFSNIAGSNKFCAVNNILEVDLTGNTVCDTIGTAHVSGIGGQHDFTVAAPYSTGGKSFLCLKSTTTDGQSRIVPKLKPGAGSTVPRHAVDYIVTEYGAVKLMGLTLRERAYALISVAHPDALPSLLEAINDI